MAGDVAKFGNDPRLLPSRELLDDGRALARDWPLVPGAFLRHFNVSCEAEYKRQAISDRRIMQHAHVGFRDGAKTRRAMAEIYAACEAAGVTVDRYGVCLDWSMGVPKCRRDGAQTGTGVVLDGPEAFVALGEAAPVALHFGDFVLGFENSVETTKYALAAGSTAIGNLGQYFTFRMLDGEDDITVTEATVQALGLIAAQPVEVLVHSNIDDGFAARFTDLTSSLGAILLEKYIIEDLIGARLAHCYGHHFSKMPMRQAFHLALAQISKTPGTMIYGDTMSYRGTDAQNFASLANYLRCDISGLNHAPTGHAINPVPVSENRRIPDIDEIIAAQLFAGRLIDHERDNAAMTDFSPAAAMAEQLVAGARVFCNRALAGMENRGIDTSDAGQILLAIRRLGGAFLEREFGAGVSDESAVGGRRPLVASGLTEDIQDMTRSALANVSLQDQARIRDGGLKLFVATTDVHEHGKLVLENVFCELGCTVIDCGATAPPCDIAARARELQPDAIAISTYNGLALSYARQLKSELDRVGYDAPILIGGQLNQIPEASNTSLPVDVHDQLVAEGVFPCRSIDQAIPYLVTFAKRAMPPHHDGDCENS